MVRPIIFVSIWVEVTMDFATGSIVYQEICLDLCKTAAPSPVRVRMNETSPRLSEQIGKLTKRLDLCHAFVILTGDIFKAPYKPSSTTD